MGKVFANGFTRGSEAVVENFADDDCMVRVNADLSSGSTAVILVRHIDANSAYRILLDSNTPSNDIKLHKLENDK